MAVAVIVATSRWNPDQVNASLSAVVAKGTLAVTTPVVATELHSFLISHFSGSGFLRPWNTNALSSHGLRYTKYNRSYPVY
jgi:hypothetical protein